MTTVYTSIIKSTIPNFEEDYINLPFDEAGVDSMDLLNIRVEFEKQIGRDFSDSEWLCFGSIADIIAYCQTVKANRRHLANNGTVQADRKTINVNMPQMSIGALSENWLFKEIGDIHWDLLCTGLETPSFQLKDEMGNRLYATFVRIRVQSTIPFNEFIENTELILDSQISRFGNGMYFSKISLASSLGAIEADLMTSFSIRNDTDNTKLMKSQPATAVNNVSANSANPVFGDDYRLIKKGVLKEVLLGSVKFSITDDILFKTTYDLNPYHDINGVGLLYFAAYPIINNICEARWFNETIESSERWEQLYHILSRDILYFSNCNINDRIIYILNSFEFIDNGKVKITSSLYRESDNLLMARIFTVKMKVK